MVVVPDALGREHVFSAAPERVVSLVPSLTEALYWFGVGDRVAGVTQFCVHPPEAMCDCEVVGGTKNPDVSRILALAPDVVLANVEENRERDVTALESAGVEVFVTYARSVDEAKAELRGIGAMMGEARRAEALDREIEATVAGLVAPEPAPRVMALIWRDPFMAVGDDTFAADLLRVCGGHNVAPTADRRYPRIDAAGIAAADPDVLLLPSEPYPFAAADVRELRRELDCSAARTGRIHLMEGELLSWYGPRIPRALMTLAALLAPPA